MMPLRVLVLVVCVMCLSTSVAAQSATPSAPVEKTQAVEKKSPFAGQPITSLVVEVTIARYQGDKLLASAPHTLAVHPEGSNSRSTLRIGGEVPIPITLKEAADPKSQMNYSYRRVGTNIDAWASRTEAPDRYRVSLTIEETSVFAPNDGGKASLVVSGAPSFRSFSSSNSVTLRHNQSVEYIAATDRISGETFRITVKLTVVP